MTFIARRLFRSAAPLAAALLVGLAGCTTGPARPTAPVYSGAERPDPSRPARPGQPSASNPFFGGSRNRYEPRHLVDVADARSLKHIAVLLPFSSGDAEVKRQSRALLNAVEMAVFASGAQDIVIVPKDTGGDGQKAAAVAEQAVAEGASIIIGPLFAAEVRPVANAAATGRAPVLSFSTDAAAAGQGAFLMSLTPAAEVSRIMEYARSQGVTKIALLGPSSGYGRAIDSAMRTDALRTGMTVIASEFYAPGNTSPLAEAKRLTTLVKAEDRATPGKVAVLIPERGVQLRSVVPLLPYFDVNIRRVKVLGTGSWNDPDVWREPSLWGGAFAAPDPAGVARFEQDYKTAFGAAPPRLASFGYDAGALAVALARANQLDATALQRGEGFAGVNGLFRFGPDGSAERGLAVLQVTDQGGVAVIAPAGKSFAGS